ncbi:MAG: nucleotidyl transferase AbiEii/AbiGii toxin family protein [Elusimicrobia bacterium]|nr:nucleotidyl transferase AbiEii/AbiGii toxin family protein [Elusimicrobiota bacterium]
MTDPKTYATAEAFRRALEDRLTLMAREQELDLARLRRMIAFERLLARLFSGAHPPWILKGGYAMEMRFRQTARATRDIDMSLPELQPLFGGKEVTGDRLLVHLTRADAIDLSDWFSFQIERPSAELEFKPYGGFRFPVTSRLADREFTSFHIDVALGDTIVSEPEWINGHDLLTFAGIPPARIALIPREQHFAEKIHAYTLRKDSANSRIRDFADLVILIQNGLPEAPEVTKAVHATFERRKTHAIPASLPAPPVEWAEPYRKIASDISLTPNETGKAFALVRDYWEGLGFKE